MRLYTLQLAKWREAVALDIPYLDTTVKSGDTLFSPTWDLLKRYKDGLISQNEYTTIFYQLMRESFQMNRERWLSILSQEKLAICCYCGNGHFCHRYLLVDIFSKIANQYGIPFTYMGELTKPK